MFRLHLMARTDFIWADTDAYAIRPLAADGAGYLFGKCGGKVLNGVMRLPQDSPALCDLLDFVGDFRALPDWITGDERRAFLSGKRAMRLENLRWGALGPDALDHALDATGEIARARGANVLYPIPARDKARLLAQGRVKLPENAVSLHLWGSNLRAMLADMGGGPPRGSMLELLCRDHGIRSDVPASLAEAA